MKISQRQINELLSIYKDEHQYISDVVLDDNKITCNIIETKYPYTKTDTFDYITSVSATLFACQLAYVLYGLLIERKQIEEVSHIDYASFLQSRDDAKLKFIRYNFKFISPVKNNGQTKSQMTYLGIIKKRNKVFFKTTFKIGNGITGELISTII
jgi:hypothetical protein